MSDEFKEFDTVPTPTLTLEPFGAEEKKEEPQAVEEKKPEPAPVAPLEMGIKEMPAFDPDMELIGLSAGLQKSSWSLSNLVNNFTGLFRGD